MILQWLCEDFEALFRRDPRGRVILWCDAKSEFRGLLDRLENKLSMAGISLLLLDPAEGHGPLWVKWASEVGPAADRKVVIWLPYLRESLSTRPANGLRLECLLEYRYSGLEWLIEGKTPTLFGFLKNHKVPLPSKRSEQDALWRGDADSLLVKYTLANLEQDEAFWTSRSLSADAIRDSIVGDVDERLLSFLSDPEGEARYLQSTGIATEFASQVEARYGTRPDVQGDPSGWAHGFTERLVLVEVYSATGEPKDFSYEARLPELNLRDCWGELLVRWMRDLDHVEAFIRYARMINEQLDLRGWAQHQEGSPQSLPSLARARWERFVDELAAIDSGEKLSQRLHDALPLVEQESSGFWSEVVGELPGWKLTLSLEGQIRGIAAAEKELARYGRPAEFVSAYVERWYQIDLEHWRILVGSRRTEGLEMLAEIAERFYRSYLERVSQQFYESFADTPAWPPEGCRSVSEVTGSLYSVASGQRRAIIVVDALRFDLATDLASRFENAEVEGVVANVPTETFVGMSSLLPDLDIHAEVSKGGVKLLSKKAGGDLSYRAYRWRLLKAAGGRPLTKEEDEEADDLRAVRDMVKAPKVLPQVLVMFDRGVDSLGHPGGYDVCEHFQGVLDRLERAVRKLHRWGYRDIHVVTDHGFVLLKDSSNLPAVKAPEADRVAPRYALLKRDGRAIPGGVPFPLDPQWIVRLAPGLQSFAKAEGFFHGGATLQEVVIPHVTLGFKPPAQRLRVEATVAEPVIYGQTFVVQIAPIAPQTVDLFGVEPVAVRVFLGSPDSARSNERSLQFSSTEDLPQQVTLFLNREPPTSKGERIPVQVLDDATLESYAPELFVEAGKDLE
ncbi:PglZ domain-containing protein [Candidatus Bipolaricaulota bacterium]